MFRPDIDVVRVIHAERVERDISAARAARSRSRVPRASIRRSVGRVVVRVGSWMAAEPEHARTSEILT